MEICVNRSHQSETHLPLHSDSDEHLVIENICTESGFAQADPIRNNFRCEAVCVTFVHTFHSDFLSTITESSRGSEKVFDMYGAYNPPGNPNFHPGNAKYYSPAELAKIRRQNVESGESEPFNLMPRNYDNFEQERPRRHHNKGRDIEEKLRKKMLKEKKKNKKERASYGAYYMMNNQGEEGKRDRKHRREKKKDFPEPNYYDMQYMMDSNRDDNIPPNIRRERISEMQKHQRSQSIDQIPTKDDSSDQRLQRRHERPRSAERREDMHADRNREYFMKYFSQNMQNESMSPYDQQAQYPMNNPPHPIHHSTRKHKDKSKYRKKNLRADDMPEFVTLNQINEQTMDLKDEKFDHRNHNAWDTEKNLFHHQREIYDDYHQQQNFNSPNKNTDLNTMKRNQEEYNKIIQHYYQLPGNDVDIHKTKKKDKKKDRNKEQKRKENDKEYKAIKKYMKKLAKEQQKETYFFTTKDNDEAVAPVERRPNKNKRYVEENIDTAKGYKHPRKEFIPLDLGMEELEIAAKHRKIHDHKKHKNKKENKEIESSDRLRSASLNVKEKHKNLADSHQRSDDMVNSSVIKYKSETSMDSLMKDKNVVCIYNSKESSEQRDDTTTTVKLTKKQEFVSMETEKKCRRKSSQTSEKDKERSPYNKNQLVLPTENKKQIADGLNNQERTLLFQKAMKRDFPSRPRPRLSRSRQRSSRYLNSNIDEKPTKEVHCYDVGTSTILDNNFGEVLELLKGEASVIPPCTNKKRSVFHTKKQASREENLSETSRRTYDTDEQTLGVVVKGIEPPKTVETSKVRSKFKIASEKNKINRLKCKILSVVAIAPTKLDNEEDDIRQNPMKIQSTPQLQHEKRSTSTDKKLERLLKYYKTEAQSKTNEPVENIQKSMKDLIADKLNDYLKKLQEDKSDEMMQIQTDDPKVLKLVLPIEFNNKDTPTCQDSSNKGTIQTEEKPRESFSDLYINYSAENNEDEEEHFILQEVPIGASDNRSKILSETLKPPVENWTSNQSIDSKTNEVKSILISQQDSSDLTYIEKLESSLGPKTTDNLKRSSNEIEFAKDYQFSEKQISRESTPRFLMQSASLNDNINNTNQTHGIESRSKPQPISNLTGVLNDKTIPEQTNVNKKENLDYEIGGLLNRMEITHPHQLLERMMMNLQFLQDPNSASPESILRRSMEYPRVFNMESMKQFQNELGKTAEHYNIIENQMEMNRPDPINIQTSNHRYQAPPRNPASNSNSEFMSNNTGNDFMQRENDFSNVCSHVSSNTQYGGKSLSQSEKQSDGDNQLRGKSNDAFLDERNTQDIEESNHHKLNRDHVVSVKKSNETGVSDELRNKPQSNQAPNLKSSRENSPKKINEGVCSQGKNNGRMINSQLEQKLSDNSSPKGYDYFEIPPPRAKTPKKTSECDEESLPPLNKFSDNLSTTEPKSGKTSQIPKRILNASKASEKEEKQSKNNAKSNFKKCLENIESSSWDYQKDMNELDNSLQKCLDWNIRNSETVVMSEFNDESQMKSSETGRSTVVPRKSNIPVSKKDHKSQSNQGKTPKEKEKNPTMLLTKTFKPKGQSSYEKRKMYDTRIRKNTKKRSLSESSGQAKLSPLVYEVRYCNVYNNYSPFDSGVGGSKSDQNLSVSSSSFKKSMETLQTLPSCFLKEKNSSREVDLLTEPSCFLKEVDHEKEVSVYTEPSCLLKENTYKREHNDLSMETYSLEESECYRNEQKINVCISTEPSCMLKESKYNVSPNKQRISRKNKRTPIEDRDNEETCSNYSSKSERIKELIKENLLYAKYPMPNKKTKPTNEVKKRKKKVEKEKNQVGTKIINKQKSKTKITLRCSRKSKESMKRLKIVARLNERRNDEEKEESSIQDDHFSKCQNLTKLSIDKVNDTELRVSFEEQKFETVQNEDTVDEKRAEHFSSDNEITNDRGSIEYSVSSKSTIINCQISPSVTSEDSKETIKERQVLISSPDDSGYLTKAAELNNSGTTIEGTVNGEDCCSDILDRSLTKSTEKFGYNPTPEERSIWNQKDLVKLRIQLLFPHVYDDFELVETAQNTDLIKYYVESENDKLREAISSISQNRDMSIKSRSVISLPSVKVIPEEPNEFPNGDTASEVSSTSQGGFYNYQKFVAQTNDSYSAKVLSKLSKSKEFSGDCSDSSTLKDKDISEVASVNSCSVSTVKSGITIKKSVVELFKLRPSSAKKSSSSVLSDNDTIVEGNGDGTRINVNLSNEEFYNNFHEIMAMECQKYAKKVRDHSNTSENGDEAHEYEEIPLNCLLKNKNSTPGSSEDYLEHDFQLASDEVSSKGNTSNESARKESDESFKSTTYVKDVDVISKKSSSKWEKLSSRKSSISSNSRVNLDFYPEERTSILDMIQSVQSTDISDEPVKCSPRDQVLSNSSGDVSKLSEKQFFDNLLAFYDRESELIKKLMRDDGFFCSIIEAIRNTEESTQLIFQRDIHKRGRKDKMKSILSRFFRWKEKKSAETLGDNVSIGKSIEFAKSISYDNALTAGESCYSFYKDFEEMDRGSSEFQMAHPDAEHLQQLAYKAKCHLEPMVKATISNSHISDKIKLAGFLKMLDMVARGDFTFLNTGDNKTLEDKLKEHVAQMFEKVYRIANREVKQKETILDNEKIQLLKTLVTKYHMGIETHINILSIYIGRGLIENREQLEDAIIFLMAQDSQDISLEQLEKNCGISSL